MSKIFLRHTLTKKILDIFDSYIYLIDTYSKVPGCGGEFVDVA